MASGGQEDARPRREGIVGPKTFTRLALTGLALILVSILTIARQGSTLDEYRAEILTERPPVSEIIVEDDAAAGRAPAEEIALSKSVPATTSATPRFVPPDESNTVVAMISMGKGPRDTFLAERAVRALRMSGGFAGWVLVLTDPDGRRRYGETLEPWDPKTIVMSGLEEDLRAKHKTAEKWGNARLVFKRFKTLLFKYLDADERVSDESSRHLLYLDVDAVCLDKLAPFFDDYHAFVTAEYERQMAQGRARNTSFRLSFLSAYHDPGEMGREFVHGGLMVLDRRFAAGCLDRWRHAFDTVPALVDQQLLMHAVADPELCVPFMLDGMNKSHYRLFDPVKMANGWGGSTPTFVHITSARAQRYAGDQIVFLRAALKVADRDEILFGNTTWYDAVVRGVLFRDG